MACQRERAPRFLVGVRRKRREQPSPFTSKISRSSPVPPRRLAPNCWKALRSRPPGSWRRSASAWPSEPPIGDRPSTDATPCRDTPPRPAAQVDKWSPPDVLDPAGHPLQHSHSNGAVSDPRTRSSAPGRAPHCETPKASIPQTPPAAAAPATSAFDTGLSLTVAKHQQ